MTEETNYFWEIMSVAAHLMNTEFTLYGFTLSYWKVFIFSFLCIVVFRCLFLYLWG